MKNILMIGPSRDMQGGIVSVVDSYYSIGINEKVNIKYISTIDNSVGFKKLAYFIKSLILILSVIKKFEVVHIHMASSGSWGLPCRLPGS